MRANHEQIFLDLSKYIGGLTTTPIGYPDLDAITKELEAHPEQSIEGVTLHTEHLPIKSNVADRSVPVVES